MEYINPRIALVAHDARKDAMIEWARKHEAWLSQCPLFTTGTTGKRIEEATNLNVTRMLSGPLGGDQQIGAMIAEGRLDVLIFFYDPLSSVPHDVDVKALLRISTVYHIAVAMNERTADLLVLGLAEEKGLQG